MIYPLAALFSDWIICFSPVKYKILKG